jgi:hypothetical protein
MRYTKADIGKTVEPHVSKNFDLSCWADSEPQMPSGEYKPCPTCGDPEHKRMGTGQVRHDFINRTSKNLNGYIAKPGVNVEFFICGTCDGEGEIWVND